MKLSYCCAMLFLVTASTMQAMNGCFNRFLVSLDKQIYQDEQGNEITFSPQKHAVGDFILPYDHDWYFERGHLYLFVLRTHKQEYIGFLKIFVLDYALWRQKTEEGPYGFITELEIAPQFRRQGYARALIREAYKVVTAHNLPMVALEVRSNDANIPAIRLYESMGFAQDKEWTTKYVMMKKLEIR